MALVYDPKAVGACVAPEAHRARWCGRRRRVASPRPLSHHGRTDILCIGRVASLCGPAQRVHGCSKNAASLCSNSAAVAMDGSSAVSLYEPSISIAMVDSLPASLTTAMQSRARPTRLMLTNM